MGKRYQSLQEDHADFIRAQKLFFVGTATNDGTINVSPKGWDSLRLMDANRLVWRNVTGSGNETACLLYTSPSPRDLSTSRMPSSA